MLIKVSVAAAAVSVAAMALPAVAAADASDDCFGFCVLELARPAWTGWSVDVWRC